MSDRTWRISRTKDGTVQLVLCKGERRFVITILDNEYAELDQLDLPNGSSINLPSTLDLWEILQ